MSVDQRTSVIVNDNGSKHIVWQYYTQILKDQLKLVSALQFAGNEDKMAKTTTGLGDMASRGSLW